MAFDYGSIDLGLKNPFKTEGAIVAVRGTIQAILGLYILLTAASIVKESAIIGWILMLFGIFILAGVIRQWPIAGKSYMEFIEGDGYLSLMLGLIMLLLGASVRLLIGQEKE